MISLVRARQYTSFDRTRCNALTACRLNLNELEDIEKFVHYVAVDTEWRSECAARSVRRQPLVLLLGGLLLPMASPAGAEVVLISMAISAISLAAFHWLIQPWTMVRWPMENKRPAVAPRGPDCAAN